jgi:L-alanine-DL-glutamate epimerase-like enolase superfamily enzyme
VKLSVHPYFLEFHRPFALAHGTRSGTQLAFVKIEYKGIRAFGEASLPPYFPETLESVEQWVLERYDQVKETLKNNPFSNRTFIPYSSAASAASNALQTAILNWYVAAHDIPLNEGFASTGLSPGLTLTLTKADLEVLDEKLQLAKRFSHLKLKLTGSEDDMDFVQSIRNRTDLPFCIDVNQGCSDKEAALRLASSLERCNCTLLEQPLSAHDHEGHNWLKERTALPIIADESIRNMDELEQFHEAYSGVNVKLMKCGGIFQAERMLDFIGAQYPSADYLKLLGCMSESSLGVSTSALLASRFELADLDAPYLCKNDPFKGFRIEKGEIHLDRYIGLRKEISL